MVIKQINWHTEVDIRLKCIEQHSSVSCVNNIKVYSGRVELINSFSKNDNIVVLNVSQKDLHVIIKTNGRRLSRRGDIFQVQEVFPGLKLESPYFLENSLLFILKSLERPSGLGDSCDNDVFFVFIEDIDGSSRKTREVIDLKTLVDEQEDFMEIDFGFYESDDFIGFYGFFIAVHGASFDVQPEISQKKLTQKT